MAGAREPLRDVVQLERGAREAVQQQDGVGPSRDLELEPVLSHPWTVAPAAPPHKRSAHPFPPQPDGDKATCMSDKPEMPATPPQQVQLQIDIDPVTANGAFINLAMVNFNENEFTLDLAYVQPQAPRATVRARAITSPKHMKRLMLAIQDSVQKYEQRFGVLDLGGSPHFPGRPMN